MQWQDSLYSAFEGTTRLAEGPLLKVAAAAKAAMDRAARSATPTPVLVFDDATSETMELDWRGTLPEFRDRLVRLAADHAHAAAGASSASSEATDVAMPAEPGTDAAARGPGRPKLGVVAREVTLLPRHWSWLAARPGGASVALRKLVEEARRRSEADDRQQQARAVVYRFMSTLMGNAPGFEEASRALFAGDRAAFQTCTAAWPADVRAHLAKIAAGAFQATAEEAT